MGPDRRNDSGVEAGDEGRDPRDAGRDIDADRGAELEDLDAAYSDAAVALACEELVPPCGGEVLGVWGFRSWCAEGIADGFRASCGGTFTRVYDRVEGTLALNSDGIATLTTTTSYEWHVEGGVGCFAVLGGCENYAAALRRQGRGDCELAETCRCVLASNTYSSTVATYEVEGATLRLRYRDGVVATYSYCVADGRMQWKAFGGSDFHILERVQ
jgi:hypothetical protein